MPWLTGAALSFLVGAASAETSGSYVSADTPVLLPIAFTLAQPDISQTASLDSPNSFGTVYGYNLGNGFQIAATLEDRDAAANLLSHASTLQANANKWEQRLRWWNLLRQHPRGL